jgi:hypothetical protein
MSTSEGREGVHWPHLALVLGGSGSVAANVAHAYVHGSPAVGAVVASVLWPVMVVVAVELLISTPWPAGWTWAVTRFVGVGLVGVVAAVVSYRHMSGLLTAYGEDHVVSGLGPVAVDGLMVMATASLVAVRRVRVDQGRRHLINTTDQPLDPRPADTPDPSAPAAHDASSLEKRPVQDRRTSTPRATARRATRPTESAAELLAQRVLAAGELIASGALAERPSAEAIRKALGGSAAISRAVRDALTTSTEPAAEPASVETDHIDSPLRLAR